MWHSFLGGEDIIKMCIRDSFKVHLVFFQELDEETEEEDFRQAEAEEETAVIG